MNSVKLLDKVQIDDSFYDALDIELLKQTKSKMKENIPLVLITNHNR